MLIARPQINYKASVARQQTGVIPWLRGADDTGTDLK
jgi:hypothetical protein